MTTTTNTQPKTAWDMACAIYVGLYKAEAQARAEYLAAIAKADHKPFGPGVSPVAHTLEVIRETRRTMEPELRAVARANGFAIPAIERNHIEGAKA